MAQPQRAQSPTADLMTLLNQLEPGDSRDTVARLLTSAGRMAEWPPEAEQLEPAAGEVAQGWDSMHPRPMKRGGWDALPDDVQESFDTLDTLKREASGLTANLDSLSKGQKKRNLQRLRGIQDRLHSIARSLWMREAKSILLDRSGQVAGVAEYQGAQWAVEVMAEITARIGAERAAPQAKPDATQRLLSGIAQDGGVFLETCQAQMEAGDVQEPHSPGCGCCH